MNESLLDDLGIDIMQPSNVEDDGDDIYDIQDRQHMGVRRLSQTANVLLKPPSSVDDISQASIGSTTTHKSHRFAAQFNSIFDELQNGDAVAMITRKDASKAQKDEILLKSDKYYIREFVEERAARLIQQKSLFNQTF
jgi:hypothetical protein